MQTTLHNGTPPPPPPPAAAAAAAGGAGAGVPTHGGAPAATATSVHLLTNTSMHRGVQRTTSAAAATTIQSPAVSDQQGTELLELDKCTMGRHW